PRHPCAPPPPLRPPVPPAPPPHVPPPVPRPPVAPPRQLPCRRHDRLGAPGPRPDAPVERPQRVLGAMATLGRHPQRPPRPTHPPPHPPAAHLPRRAPVLRAQPQPRHELLGRREPPHVRPHLA